LSTESKKIVALIAEDHQSIAEIYKMMLELEGHSVIVVQDGIDCIEEFDKRLQKMHEHSGLAEDSPFDVVILDYHLPRRDGVEIAKHILSVAPGQRIVMASSYPKEIIQTSARDLDRSIELMTKPFDLVEFIETVTMKKRADTIGGPSATSGKTVDQVTQ
jgi:two-component system cell cycle response regulator CpdR